MSYTFTFIDRESYLAYRAAWREQYRILSEKIREQKQLRKQQDRDHDPKLTSTIYSIIQLKASARAMLEERSASKEASARQRELQEYA